MGTAVGLAVGHFVVNKQKHSHLSPRPCGRQTTGTSGGMSIEVNIIGTNGGQ